MHGQTKRRGTSGRSKVRSLTVSATGPVAAPRLVTTLYELLDHARQFTTDDAEAVELISQIINARRARMGRCRVRIEGGEAASTGREAGWQADSALRP